MNFGTDSYLLATCPVTDDGRGTFDQYPVGANCSERQSPKMEELGEQPAKMRSNHLLGSKAHTLEFMNKAVGLSPALTIDVTSAGPNGFPIRLQTGPRRERV
jgi:hypothetical protein